MSCKSCDCNQPQQPERRSFLGGSVSIIASMTILPGLVLHEVKAKPDDQRVSAKNRWGILIDTRKCTTECEACVTACHKKHGIETHGRPDKDPQWIRKLRVEDPLTRKVSSFPIMCQHCEHPPCADVCPTGASFRREDGIVLVDRHLCIGCRYCMMACPYKARSFLHEDVENPLPHTPRGKGTVESCNLCVYTVDKGGIPACVEACKLEGHQAMIFGDLNDPESEISQALLREGGQQIREDLGLNTGVRYQGIN